MTIGGLGRRGEIQRSIRNTHLLPRRSEVSRRQRAGLGEVDLPVFAHGKHPIDAATLSAYTHQLDLCQHASACLAQAGNHLSRPLALASEEDTPQALPEDPPELGTITIDQARPGTMKLLEVTMKRFCASLLCVFALSAQAATWHFKDTVQADPWGIGMLSPITGLFVVEQDGNIPFWDISTYGVGRFTSLPFCGPPETDPYCARFQEAGVSSPTSLFFSLSAGTPGTSNHFVLELAAPLGSGADTIALVPGRSYIAHGPEVRLVTAGSITTIPEPETITAAALGLALLVCLHLRVRAELRCRPTARRIA